VDIENSHRRPVVSNYIVEVRKCLAKAPLPVQAVAQNKMGFDQVGMVSLVACDLDQLRAEFL
jgi:hypothetical protein